MAEMFNNVDVKLNIARGNSINNYAITDFCNNIDECDENMSEKIEMFHEDLTLYLPFQKRVLRFLEFANIKIWIYIVTVAVIAGVTGATVDWTGRYLMNWRIKAILWFEFNEFYMFCVFWVSMFGFCLISTVIVDRLAPGAAGSGVPPLKSVLGGVHIYKFLHWKVLIAKFFGLIGTLASGVGSGKEGPMIHMSAMICYNLGYLPFFNGIISDPFRKKMLLNAAVACGVTSTFGAPYGALIFSIELCSTVFLISNVWKLFVTVTVVKLIYDIAFYWGIVASVRSDFIYDDDTKWQNLPHYIMLGLISGWVASLWIWVFSQWMQFKSQAKVLFLRNRYFYVLFITLVISLIQFWSPTSLIGNKGMLTGLWSHYDLVIGMPDTFGGRSAFEGITVAIIQRWFVIMCFATMPIPSGIALPSITQGALIGRFYGQILHWYNPWIQPQAFSIVGAAAYGGVMTRCTSITLLIIEMTGQIDLMLGILMATMFSYAIAN
jgi:H+/Cl- antiporter ClcA